LTEQFDIFSKGIDELGHHGMGKYHAADDLKWSPKILHEIDNKLVSTTHHDRTGAKDTSMNMIRDSSPYGGGFFVGVGTIVGR
jgi:hypothetical protein